MFGEYSYLGYTLLFCVPPILFLWLRRGFRRVLRRDLRRIALATMLLTLYGSAIWPIALAWNAWAYNPQKVAGIMLFGYVHLEDVVWWALTSFLLASFVSVSSAIEASGASILRALRYRHENR